MKKKLISMLLVAACVAMMGGCGNEPKADVEDNSKSSESEVTVDENGKVQYNPEDYVELATYNGTEISIPAKVEYDEEEYKIEVRK